ncbi:MAG: methylmalonyl-CoA epimerase [Chloroflexota bacterium]
MKPKRVDHIAIAVRDLEAALEFFRERLGLDVDQVVTVERDRVRVAFLPVGDTHLELLEPLDEAGPVARFIDRRGEGLHHVCLEVEDIGAALAELGAAGVELIDRVPRPGAEGLVAFIHPKSSHGVLLELVQKPGEVTKP